MPESKAELLTSVNEAAGLVQKVFFTYLLVSLYLAVLIGSTTHEQMLRESGVQLPLFGVGLSVFWVYAVAPWLYLALHVNLLVQHYLLSRKLHAFNRALGTPNKEGKLPSKEEEDEWRVRLYPSMFAQMLVGAERDRFKGFVVRSIVFLTVAVAPVVLLLWTQIRFLPYHSEPVTWGNRLALFVDLVLLWYYWPQFWQRDQSAASEVGRQDGWHPAEPMACVVSFLVVYFSMFVAVVPGGIVEQMTNTETPDKRWRPAACVDQGESTAGILRRDGESAEGDQGQSTQTTDRPQGAADLKCLSNGVRACLTRHLDVREVKLLAEEPPPELLAALMTDDNSADENKNMAKTLRERTVGLTLEDRDLRGANFRHADLTKADLAGAELNGADLGCTKLIGAILFKAKMADANLTGAALHGVILHEIVLPAGALRQMKGLRTTVNLKKARLIGADLESMDMDGAGLSHAKLQGASLQGAKLRGANLENADLRGANLRRARLQGADLSHADLRGADLRGASVGGAKFVNADLSHADLRDIYKHTDAEDLDVIKDLEGLAADGDRLAEDAVDRLTSADGKPINLSGANGESVRCGKLSPDPLKVKVECLKENEIEKYRRDLVEDVLVPPFCGKEEDKKEILSKVEASALLDALIRRASLADEHENSTPGGPPRERGQTPAIAAGIAETQTGTKTGTKTVTKTVTKTESGVSVASLLAEALRKPEDCHGRDAFVDKEDFDIRLQRLDRTQPTE